MSAALLIFFFNDTATTEIYTLSLHDALPISLEVPGLGQALGRPRPGAHRAARLAAVRLRGTARAGRRSGGGGGGFGDLGGLKRARLESSHPLISYAVFFF